MSGYALVVDGFRVELGYVGRPIMLHATVSAGPKSAVGRLVWGELEEAEALQLAAELIAGVERRRRRERIRAEGFEGESIASALRHRETSELLEVAEEALLERDRRAGVTS